MLWGQLVMNCRAGIYVDGESAEGPRFQSGVALSASL